MDFYGKFRTLVKATIIGIVMSVYISMGQAATAACRQALILGLDVSGSVDSTEYSQQIQGLVSALYSPRVQDAILADPSSYISLTVFEWSGPTAQRIILPWVDLHSKSDIEKSAARLAGVQRTITDVTTAIGKSIAFAQILAQSKSDCWQTTFDISGDGKSNTGPRPQDTRNLDPALIINALVIGVAPSNGMAQAEINAELSAYFSAYVVTPGIGFVELAQGYQDYARAMERKLVKELQVLTIGALAPHQ